MSRVPIALVLQFLPCATNLGEDAPGMFQQASACICEHHTATVALEEILTQFHFELAYLAAECRLHHRKKRRCPRKAPQLGDVAEVLELF